MTTYTAHGESVIGVAFVEGDKEVTSVGLDRKLHRWQVEDGKALAKVELPAMPVRMSARGPHAWLGLNDRNWLAVELPHPSSRHFAADTLPGSRHLHWIQPASNWPPVLLTAAFAL